MPNPLVILAEFTVPSGHRDAFLELCAFDSTSSVRDEPGCLQFDVLTDPDVPDGVVLHEVYVDPAAFDAHKRTPHYATFAEGVSRLGVILTRLRMLSHRHP